MPWICGDSQGVVEDACNGEGCEHGGIGESGGGDEAKPRVDEEEDGGEVDIGNDSNCRLNVEGFFQADVHCHFLDLQNPQPHSQPYTTRYHKIQNP